MKEEFRRATKRPLNILFMVLGCLLITATFFYVHTDRYETFELRNKSEVAQINASLLGFQIVNSEDGNGTYQNLLLQKSILAKQLNSVLFDDPQKYITTSHELTELRLNIREDTDFNDRISIFQPNLVTTLNENIYYNYLKETNGEVILKPESFGSLSLLFLSLLGIIWFPVCAFLTANTLEDEYEHSTLVKGQPKTFMKRTLTKFSVLYIMYIISFTSALGLGLFWSQLLGNNVNDINNVDVIQLIHFSILKKWEIILIYFLYLSILLLFVFMLSVCLNILFKNFYLTLIVELIIYALTILLPEFISRSPWYVGSFFIPTYLFDGKYLSDKATTLINPVFGMCYLVLASLLLGFLISLMDKRGMKGVRG